MFKFSVYRGNIFLSSSLRFLRHKFSLIAISFDKTGKMNTPFLIRTVCFLGLSLKLTWKHVQTEASEVMSVVFS